MHIIIWNVCILAIENDIMFEFGTWNRNMHEYQHLKC